MTITALFSLQQLVALRAFPLVLRSRFKTCLTWVVRTRY